MSSIALNKIALNKQRITYSFSVPDELKVHINPAYMDQNNNGTLFVELPDGIEVKEVDKEYFNTVKKIDAVFKKMYPKGNLNLVLDADKVTECQNYRGAKTSVFFTGGVDATSALVETVTQKPLLINIAGGDIALSDDKAHEHLENYFKELKSNIDGLDYCFVKSNCREFFREYTFDKMCKKFIDRELWWGYWASIAHIIVMIASVAPVIYAKGITEHYIGSSHSSKDEAFDGNNEDIINAINYAGCKFVSADADLDRNDKVKKIVDYSNESGVYFKLQVCWHKKNGLNCCRCEKCYRTTMNVLSAHGDPNKFGLKYDTDKMKEIQLFLETTPIKLSYWETTQNVFRREADYWNNTELAWFIDFKFNQLRAYFNKAVSVLKARIRSK